MWMWRCTSSMTTIASSTTKAGGQRDAEQRERVDGEVEDTDEREGADQRDGDGDGGNDGGSPIEQEQEDNSNDDDNRDAKRIEHFADRVARPQCGVERNSVLKAGREVLGKLRERGLGTAIDVERVGIGELLDANTHGLMAHVLEVGAVVFGRDLSMTNVFELHRTLVRAEF